MAALDMLIIINNMGKMCSVFSCAQLCGYYTDFMFYLCLCARVVVHFLMRTETVNSAGDM